MAASNVAQIEYWNGAGGERWAAGRDRIERNLAAITDALFAFAAPRPGERVIDIGCGCGRTTIELHRRTGAPAVGLDVSGRLLAIAREQLRPGLAVSFVEGDASQCQLEASFDLVFSRFGVMFFADPIAAFANLRAALAPGGRMAFVCWRSFDGNPWAAAPLAAARPLLPPQEPIDPHAPGAFALADGARLRGILEAAGWRDITTTALETTMHLGDTLDDATAEALLVGPLARIAADLDDPMRARIRERVAEAFAPFVSLRGVVLPAAVWLVGAR